MNKLFKNVTNKSADFYVYGAIVDEKTVDWWTGETSKVDVDPLQFKDELNALDNDAELNIYINSGGGSVFASSTMVSMLQRFKQNGGKVHAFIDGLCASASTYLCMVADEITIYMNSILMVHKPMTVSMGNANDLQKDIDTLNTIQNSMMLPLYMEKAKVNEDEMTKMVNDETWLDANEIDRCFNVTYVKENKEVENCYSKRLFMNYAHVPEHLKLASNEKKPKQQKVENIDYSTYKLRIEKAKEKRNEY